MESVIQMAGYYAATAIETLSQSERFMPCLVHLTNDGQYVETPLLLPPVQAAAKAGEAFSQISNDNQGVIFISDVIVSLKTGKVDAIVAEVKFAEAPEKSMSLIVPYRPANHAKGFAVHRFSINQMKGFNRSQLEWATNAVSDGLEAHKAGFKIWQASYEHSAGDTAQPMDYGAEFSKEEIAHLKLAPTLIFLLVASPKGDLSEKHTRVLSETLMANELLENPLFHRIATNIVGRLPETTDAIMHSTLDIRQELTTIASIIDNRLSAEQAWNFKLLLLKMAKKIAKATSVCMLISPFLCPEKHLRIHSISQYLGIEQNDVVAA